MKDLASGLAASYMAELAHTQDMQFVPEKLQFVPQSPGGGWIKGRLNFEFREVFEAYYAQPVQKGIEMAPHILFARCPDDVESIIQFTSHWGPLHRPKQEPPGSGFDRSIFTEEELSDIRWPSNYFCFTPFWWRSVQQRFKECIERLARPTWEPWETGLEEHLPLHTHTISFSVQRQRDALAPTVRAGSLIEAFWLMLWLDTAKRGRCVRICANPKCTLRIFRTSRPDQIYCSARCKELVNKRNYWIKNGSDRRRAHGRLSKKALRVLSAQPEWSGNT